MLVISEVLLLLFHQVHRSTGLFSGDWNPSDVIGMRIFSRNRSHNPYLPQETKVYRLWKTMADFISLLNGLRSGEQENCIEPYRRQSHLLFSHSNHLPKMAITGLRRSPDKRTVSGKGQHRSTWRDAHHEHLLQYGSHVRNFNSSDSKMALTRSQNSS
jgi:hypothetical protein